MTRARRWIVHLGFATLLSLLGSAARADGGPAAEVRRRNDALVEEGFNLTRGLTFSAAGTTLELLVPPGEGEHVVSLWFASASAGLAVRLVAPDGDVVAAFTGKSGEQRLVRQLAPGKYLLTVAGAAGHGVVGVKGPVIVACPIPGERMTEHAAAPARGFYWPYLVAAPPAGQQPAALLVLPNNTGFVSDDLAMLRGAATCELRRGLKLADRLGVAVLVPVFPRPPAPAPQDNLYLHALARAALEVKTPALARVDLQLIAMIDHAREQLGGVGPRVLIAGFSASGSFANRFTVLHPERVLAAAVGSPGGWPLAPTGGAGMTYPVGIADAARLTGKPVDLAALREVELLFVLGDRDTNDAVPYRDSFSAADQAVVMRRFGKTPVARWGAARRLYERAGLRATFKLYPGVGHDVTAAMAADIVAFFQAALAR